MLFSFLIISNINISRLEIGTKLVLSLYGGEHRRRLITWLVLHIQRETASRLGIEPPTTLFGLGTSPLSSGSSGHLGHTYLVFSLFQWIIANPHLLLNDSYQQGPILEAM